MMIATLRWRDEFKIEEAMKETYPDMLNGFGHLYGRDKQGRPVMYQPFSSMLPQLIVLAGITYMVGKTTLKLPSATSSGSFGTKSPLPLIAFTFWLTLNHRWRVALMEEGIKQVDFETVDQMIQVHGTDCPFEGISEHATE
jgi:phosphatidylinositol transfer protein SFH5